MLGHICIADVNEALAKALPMLLRHGKTFTADSVANARATIEWDGLFVTEWWKPQRNVLFDPVRDANPFFHYLEAMWLLAGREDVAYLAHILPRMRDFSDDGEVFHGAYGHRLRQWPGEGGVDDQIEQAIAMLKKSPNSRQVVLSVWNPTKDLGTKTKDMPCNDMIMLKLREGRLHLTVGNRSNDAVLGCYGANAVQFSTLLMYLAARIGCEIGTYWQVSNSFHVYADNPYWLWFTEQYERDPDNWHQPLLEARCKYANLVRGGEEFNPFAYGIERFDEELSTFMVEADAAITRGGDTIPQFAQSLAIRTAISLWNALHWHRAKDDERAYTELWNIELHDWQCAAREWLQRRATPKINTAMIADGRIDTRMAKDVPPWKR